MSRRIVDISGPPKRLVVAARTELELADQLAVQSDHTDALIGDQELDLTPLVGSPQPDVVQAAHVAQAHLAGGVDRVVPDPEVRVCLCGRRPCLQAGAIGSGGAAAV